MTLDTPVREAPEDPSTLLALVGQVTTYHVLAAALRLGIFEALGDGAATVEELAGRAGARPAGVAVLCGVLADTGLVVVGAGGRVSATATGAAFLGPRARRRLDGLVLDGPGRVENLLALAATVRGAAPPRPVEDDPAFWVDLFEATLGTQMALALATARVTGVAARGAVQVLEVGPNAGAWGLALAVVMPAALVRIETTPSVVDHVAIRAEAEGVADRVIASGRAGGHQADIVILANATRGRAEAAAKAVVSAAARRLAPGGLLLDADYLTDGAGRAGAMARVMAATMLANTVDGLAHSEARHREWLTGAGLVVGERIEPVAGFTVLTARRAVAEDAA